MFVVAHGDALTEPYAVMVKLLYAHVTHSAMESPRGSVDLARFAELELSHHLVGSALN